MAFFSPSSSPKKDEGKPQAIPADILSSVRVMGDENKVEKPTSSRPADVPTNLPIVSASPSSPSPFLGTSSPAPLPVAPQTPPSVPQFPSPEKKKDIPFSPSFVKTQKTPAKLVASPSAPAWPKTAIEKPSPGKKWPLFLVIGLIIFLVLAGGGYYYWQNEKTKKELSNEEKDLASNLPLESELNKTPPIKTLPYALDKPNYLSLDTETAEISGIKKNIDEVTARLVESKVAEPIEFVITDKNNNPLAFSRFVYLMDLSLPEALLAQIEEPFSLYLAAEGGRPVVGLKLALKDPAQGSTLITQAEGRLPGQFAPLLYPGVSIPIPAMTTFAPSPSRADIRIVRYHNFSLEPNISFDYTVSGKQWLIGTSKEMFRVMLEKAE